MRLNGLVILATVFFSIIMNGTAFLLKRNSLLNRSVLGGRHSFSSFAGKSVGGTLESDYKLAPVISWYPGHIAKAERELKDYLKNVDVVIEVRDARIPLATTHPMVPSWVGNKPLIVAIARLDQISTHALRDWKEYYAMHPAHEDRPDAKVFFIDGKMGNGVLAVKREALKAGAYINEKREKKGIQPRAVRAAVIGFPNVGKSALINRLLGRKMATSYNMPGVTKAMRWIRVGGDAGASKNNLELLDSPGIIPARQFDQKGAYLLAMCNDIGQASYDRILVAIALCDQLNQLYRRSPSHVDMKQIKLRYKLPFDEMNGEEILFRVAESSYARNQISAADKILGDFRKGLLNFGSLESTVYNNLVLSQENDPDYVPLKGGSSSRRQELESLRSGGRYPAKPAGSQIKTETQTQKEVFVSCGMEEEKQQQEEQEEAMLLHASDVVPQGSAGECDVPVHRRGTNGADTAADATAASTAAAAASTSIPPHKQKKSIFQTLDIGKGRYEGW
jgi:ribosome biogenesis GTPase A